MSTTGELIAKHGILKFPSAYCRERGWRPTAQGRPAQWYEAWRAGIGREAEEALRASSAKDGES